MRSLRPGGRPLASRQRSGIFAKTRDAPRCTSGDTLMARQPYLPESELCASHVSCGNEDKGLRLVRCITPDRHFSARPRTWGLARLE
jgi:hypothetical protein